MDRTLFVIGLVLVVAGIAGGGVKIANNEIHAVSDVRRQILLGLVGAAVVVLAFVMPAPPASGGGSPGSWLSGAVTWVRELFQRTEAEIRIEPDRGSRGDAVQLTARGFRAGERVTVYVHLTQIGQFRADSNGELFRETVVIPRDAVCFDGQCQVRATGSTSVVTEIAVFTLTG